MEPAEQRRPSLSSSGDDRLLKGGSDLWLPLPPDEMPPGDLNVALETGEKLRGYILLQDCTGIFLMGVTVPIENVCKIRFLVHSIVEQES